MIFKKTNSIIIVSGLPRSGTSMMMKMFEAGGIEVITDNARKPDVDNPKGYYEFEKVKQIHDDKSWLSGTKGKAIKMVSELLPELPDRFKYHIIFMRRNMKEVIASQKKMLNRLGKPEGRVMDSELAELLNKSQKRIESWLNSRPNISVLYVFYNEVIKNPLKESERIASFLDRRVDPEGMSKVVDKSLYRNRNNDQV